MKDINKIKHKRFRDTPFWLYKINIFKLTDNLVKSYNIYIFFLINTMPKGVHLINMVKSKSSTNMFRNISCEKVELEFFIIPIKKIFRYFQSSVIKKRKILKRFYFLQSVIGTYIFLHVGESYGLVFLNVPT